MIINLELLKSLGACEDGIERFIKHFNGTLELPDDTFEYSVCDELYNDLRWLVNKLCLSIKCINKDNGYWCYQSFNSNNFTTYYENSHRYWIIREFDSNNNQTYQLDSYNRWMKYEYDSNNNKIKHTTSYGYWEVYEYDSDNNLTYFENSLKEIKGTKRA
jgi:hypothetical protein